MNAGTTWTIRSYAQFQGDFWGNALDEFGYFFIGGSFFISGLVSQVLYEFLGHSGSVISEVKRKILERKIGTSHL
jgi:hypothetical protein